MKNKQKGLDTTYLAEQGFVGGLDCLTLIVVVINKHLYYHFFVCTCNKNNKRQKLISHKPALSLRKDRSPRRIRNRFFLHMDYCQLVY